MVIEQGIEIVVDLREQEREAVFQKSGAEDMSADVSVDHGPQAEDNRGGLAKPGSEESNPKSVKKKRGKGQFSSIKTHPMKTRGLKSSTECGAKQRKVIWNFEEEIAKVIEMGVARRLERETRDKEVSSRTSWNTEEEDQAQLQGGEKLKISHVAAISVSESGVKVELSESAGSDWIMGIKVEFLAELTQPSVMS
ncbi:hypothetical protein LWI29_027221 [Acer saccharum]|uniref:Uncharacterized protein n=1 Tax=Acer saccharum TaxID=4024 RepID=A0AA39VX40_ACESA|nr:hypothetical protein LWI29_027221 [Acer saccharum]